MININLANYRDYQQKKRFYRFFVIMLISTCMAIFLCTTFYLYYSYIIICEESKNSLIQSKVDQINMSLAVVDEFKNNLEKYTNKLNHLHSISFENTKINNLLFNLDSITPGGLYYKELSLVDSVFKLQGFAKQSIYLETLLNNLRNQGLSPILTKSSLVSNKVSFTIMIKESEPIHEGLIEGSHDD